MHSNPSETFAGSRLLQIKEEPLGITIPMLMLIAEHDQVTLDWNAEIVLNGVPDQSKVTFRKIENAGHFSFLSPFPKEMRKPGFLPSTDPEGFDCELFHQ